MPSLRATSPFARAAWRWCSVVVGVIALAACEQRASVPAMAGDADNGRLLLRQYGCGGCHRIHGVAGAEGKVGPALDGLRTRVYLAGVIPNTPENLVRWIRAPQAIDPLTAMPDLRVTDAHARDMAAYLYRLD